MKYINFADGYCFTFTYRYFVKRNNLPFLLYKIKMPTKPPTHYFRYVTKTAQAMKYFLKLVFSIKLRQKKRSYINFKKQSSLWIYPMLNLQNSAVILITFFKFYNPFWKWFTFKLKYFSLNLCTVARNGNISCFQLWALLIALKEEISALNESITWLT